ncbi:MAG TPA: S-methyl-5'-thioadenosine phosphorylase [Thermomicrobiales bacterium]|nr:S-methyl-5'-thioadenosine phosphorylase [Thermomicrobiales bacterium]
MPVLGIIGGSGLYDMPGLERVEEALPETPYGMPSSPIISGYIGETHLAFLARHGRGHVFAPTDVPYRANIAALRSLGVRQVLSISAVGSLQEPLAPRSAVIPDQIIDRTTSRPRTFFDDGIVAHVGMADPFCSTLSAAVQAHAGASSGGAVHAGGTYLCIEGPQFSTRAESYLFRSWGADIIGMTAMPEARLAREAGMCYAMLAMVTDYDVWHESEADVSVEAVQRVLRDNIDVGRAVIQRLADAGIPACGAGCRDALEHAIITDERTFSETARSRLAFLTDA